MAQTYLGFFHWAAGVPTTEDIERLRKQGSAGLEELLTKVRRLPANLPPSCKLVSAWQIGTQNVLSVVIVEAESRADLQFIDDYYMGWFQADWHPTTLIARD